MQSVWLYQIICIDSICCIIWDTSILWQILVWVVIFGRFEPILSHCRSSQLVSMHKVLSWSLLICLRCALWYHSCFVCMLEPWLPITCSMLRALTGAASFGACTYCQAGAYSSASGEHQLESRIDPCAKLFHQICAGFSFVARVRHRNSLTLMHLLARSK